MAIDENIRRNWEQFLHEQGAPVVFQSPSFVEVYQDLEGVEPGWVYTTDSSGWWSGVLVYIIIQETGWKSKFSRRAIVMGGPIIKNQDPELLEQLLQSYLRTIKDRGIIYTEIRLDQNHPEYAKTYDSLGFRYIPHLNIHIPLNKTADEILSGMHPKRRANIQRAKRKGVSIRELKNPAEISAAENLIKITYQRINLPAPPAGLFLRARQVLENKLVVLGAFFGEELIAVRFYLISGNVIYDWYAGSKSEMNHLHPNDLLPFEMMKRGSENGFHYYDFGGAGHPERKYGVRVYKQRFGGNLFESGRRRCIHNLLKYRLGKIALKLYKLQKRK